MCTWRCSRRETVCFAGLVFLSLYLAGKVHLYDRKGHTLKAWLVWIPIVAATLVAISRTMDYRHHATDVIAGAILGILIAWFTYRLCTSFWIQLERKGLTATNLDYPSLHSVDCHLPYSPRIPRVAPEELQLAPPPPGTVERPVNRDYQRMKNASPENSYRYPTRSSEEV